MKKSVMLSPLSMVGVLVLTPTIFPWQTLSNIKLEEKAIRCGYFIEDSRNFLMLPAV